MPALISGQDNLAAMRQTVGPKALDSLVDSMNSSSLQIASTKAIEVFIIPELCKHILEYTRRKDLLRLRRVCRHFDKVINSSPTLQTLLLFKFVPTETQQPWYNLALAAKDGACDTISVNQGAAIAKGISAAGLDSLVTVAPKVYNPMLFSTVENTGHAHGIAAHMSDMWVKTDSSKSKLLLNYDKLVTEPAEHASCCRMFISQPPTKHVTIRLQGRPPLGDQERCSKSINSVLDLQVESGITFGCIVNPV